MQKLTRKEQEILDFISATLNYEYLPTETEIDLESNINDLGLDSIDIIEFIMSLEKYYKISIDDSIVIEFKTIGNIVEYINKQI